MYPRTRHRHHRSGATIILVATVAPVLIGFMALAIDVGSMYAMDAETQDAADAAALAGVSALALGDVAAAQQRAADFLASNCLSTTGAPNTVSVTLGRWNTTTRAFTANDPK